MASTETNFGEWRFAHVHVYASEPVATIAWLTNLGGVVVSARAHAGYPTMYDVELGGQTIQVRGPRGAEHFDEAGAARRFGIDHICIVTDDFEGALAALATKGIEPETEFDNGFSVPEGIAFIRGPDNLWVELAPTALYDAERR